VYFRKIVCKKWYEGGDGLCGAGREGINHIHST